MNIPLDFFEDISSYLGKIEVSAFIDILQDQDKFTILFLDDNKERTHLFARFFPNALTCEHAEEMNRLINENPNSIVFLDHDLDGRVYVDSSEINTGSEVVRFIVKNNPKIKTIVIHTMNDKVNSKMKSDLLSSGYNAMNLGFEFIKIILNRIELSSKEKK